MAYTIFNTRNSELTVVEDGTIDNTTDLKLIGKNYSGYGEIQNENFVYLLENFASANQPPRPIAGQLWFNTTSGKLEVYDGNAERAFVPLSNLHIGSLPTGVSITANNVQKGDLWWDDVTSQLYTHNGASEGDPFVLIGPKGSQSVRSEIADATVYDNALPDASPDPSPYEHKILKGYVDNTVVFVASNDEFTLDNSSAIAGFDRIKKGITLVNTGIANDGVTTGNYNFWGNASNTLRVGGVLAEEFIQRSNPVFFTQVNIDDEDGLLIGPNQEAVLRVVANEVELVSRINGASLNFKVFGPTGTSVTPLTLTTAGPMPLTDNVYDIGSSGLRWNEVYAVNFRGIADNANALLTDGTYRTSTKNNTANAIVARDSAGDIFGTSFRGTHIYNSSDVAAAITARVTRADSVQVDGSTTYATASTGATNSTVAVRDSSGNLTANQFSGLASRAATVRVPTGVVDQYEYRSASVANVDIAPHSVAVRDELGKLHAAYFVGTLQGQATSAAQLSQSRLISLTGDVSGSVSFDGTNDVIMTVSANINSVALGTDTTGNYVQSVAASVGESYLNVRVNGTLGGTANESATVLLDLDAATTNTSSTLVARDGSGNFAANVITGTRFEGHVNSVGTSSDGYFDNLTVGTLNATNFNFGANVTAIVNGGTGATTAPTARTNLDIYSKGEVDGFISILNGSIGGISSTAITNGSSNASVAPSGDITVTRAGGLHSRFSATGITLESGLSFVGTATSAQYADLAEKYTTDGEIAPGTVVTVCTHEGHELEACTDTSYPVGIVSTDPAFLMNSDLENGTAIALKGRVPTRVVGAVNKGDLLFAGANGCAVKQGVYKVAIALESNSDEGEKLVECMIVL